MTTRSINNNLPILFEDDSLLVISKPSGVHSVSSCSGQDVGSEFPLSVADQLIAYDPSFRSFSDRPEEAGLCHRLDFETSGCLLIAKSQDAWKCYRDLMSSGQVKKFYRALVHGGISKDQEVDYPIGSPYRRSKRVRAYKGRIPKGVRALPAETSFRGVQTFPESNTSIVEAILTKGRRHQVRVHAASLGCPLLGDRLYGSTVNLVEYLGCSAAPLFLLHAQKLEFQHPIHHNRLTVQAPFPSCWAVVSGHDIRY